MTTSLSFESYFKNKGLPLSPPSDELTLYAEGDDEVINFLPSTKILTSWTEEYFREFTQQKEIRLSGKNIDIYLDSITEKVGALPVSARFEFLDNEINTLSFSRNGYTLDIDKSKTQLVKQLKEKSSNIALITKLIEPEVTTNKLSNLGITTLLATGESNFFGSSPSRIRNIEISSEIYNGLLLKPGEIFSFNDLLGEVDAEAGYEPELVIKGEKLIPEYGGGICQVSTTMFRAAIYAGLPIIERSNHSLPVRYYDPQGFDATIYPGVVDLRFKNDTSGHILIQSKLSESNIVFEIYGSPNDRKIELSGPNKYDIKSDGSLKAVLKRTVIMLDGEKREDSFYSSYKSPLLFEKERNPLE